MSGEDSISILPVLHNPNAVVRDYVFTEIFGLTINTPHGPVIQNEVAAIGERYKLRNFNGQEWLFDLIQDPAEMTPLDLNDPNLQTVLSELRDVINNPLDRTLQEH